MTAWCVMKAWLPAALAFVLAPRSAAACTSCISSAFGDQTYNWAYLGLMLTPLVLCAVIGGYLGWCHRANTRNARQQLSTDPLLNEETT